MKGQKGQAIEEAAQEGKREREGGTEKRRRERESRAGGGRARGWEGTAAERSLVGEGREKKGAKPLADTGHNLIFTVLGRLYRVICHGTPLKLQ